MMTSLFVSYAANLLPISPFKAKDLMATIIVVTFIVLNGMFAVVSGKVRDIL